MFVQPTMHIRRNVNKNTEPSLLPSLRSEKTEALSERAGDAATLARVSTGWPMRRTGHGALKGTLAGTEGVKASSRNKMF